ncbi:MAG: phosphatidylserine decarboxylase family protein, partial [Planctomycetes bacterium]|nr:phosphatidylserine decarboxylase family protein [Planctomycetota bacterium]
MRVPLTAHGAKEMALAALCFGGAAAAAWVLLPTLPELRVGVAVVSGLALLFVLNFFRDPQRRPPTGEGNVVVSPADGKVTLVDRVESCEYLGGPATRVSVFLSVFNVHVNRVPLAGTVRYLRHQTGRHGNAMNAASARENERQYIGFETETAGADGQPVRYLVAQVAGAIARRIVCPVAEGQRFETGARFGMIKFGSRTEVYFPAGCGFEPGVRPGDAVKGAATLLGV